MVAAMGVEVGLAERLNGDTAFAMAARKWTGRVRLNPDGDAFDLVLDDGVVTGAEPAPAEPAPDVAGHVGLLADAETWDRLLAATPPPFFNAPAPAQALGLGRSGHLETYWQHYGAVARLVDLLREARSGPTPEAPPTVARNSDDAFDSPVGRYVHVDLAGPDGEPTDHRLYVETAGEGVPLVLQHTAGSHSAQWRHVFEDPWITERFQVVAYDLPYHGKSLPPTGVEWWQHEYRLTTEFAMSVPLAVLGALDLGDDGVFCGCSIGGLLALDLARYHPDRWRAVVAVEPALHVGGHYADLDSLWHPRVDHGYKATLMEGLTAPTSPEAFRKETGFAYSQGWPPSFRGDLWFYTQDHDLRTEAANIDTTRVGVHLLSGEYDWSATPEHGRAAHEAIAGSTFTLMEGIGHFPMSEHPEAFLAHLRPALQQVLSS